MRKKYECESRKFPFEMNRLYHNCIVGITNGCDAELSPKTVYCDLIHIWCVQFILHLHIKAANGKIPRYRRQTCPRLQIFWTTLWQYYFGRNISTFITNFMSGVSTSAIIPWISPLQQPILKLFAFSFHLFHQCVYCVLLSGVFPSFIVSNDHSTQKNVKY